MRASGWALSALVYTVVTAFLGRDILAQLGTSIANDPGDPLLTAAILHWNAQHIPWSDAWWQFPIYHPTRDTLTFSEHLLGLSVIASPIAWLTGNPLATYNLTTLLTFPLCALAMYALVYSLTRSASAAFLAGIAYGFAPYRISSLPHIQMLASFWAPLALLGLHRFLDTRRIRWLVIYGAAWALQAAANWYTLVLFTVLVGLWVLWFVVVPRNWRALGLIVGATLVGSIPLAPIVYKYLTVHAYHGFERSVDEMRAYSADVAAVLCAPSNLTFWGWIRVACRGEGELFPGVALFALFAAALVVTLRKGRRGDASGMLTRAPHRAVSMISRVLLAVAGVSGMVVASVLLAGPWWLDAGLVRVSASDIDKPLLVAIAAFVAALLLVLGSDVMRRPQSIISFYLFAAIAMWLLALGPMVTVMGEQSGRPGPFALLQALPGISGMRVPARFWLITVICLTTAAGLLIAGLLARTGRRGRAAAVVIGACALLGDGWMPRIPAQPPPARVPDAAALRNTVVLHLPIEPYPNIAATWRAVTGGWKSVNGYSGYGPNYYTALTLAASKADEAMFAPFQRDTDLHVVVSDDAPALKAAVERQPHVVVTARQHGATQYRLPRRARTSDAAPGRRVAIMAGQSECASAQVALVFDGDERSKWECLQSPESHWLTVDLGTTASIGAVVYSVGPYSWNVPSELVIETSSDGATWTVTRRGSILGELIEGGLADAGSLRAVLQFPAHEARYVRMRPAGQPEEFAWFVSEIEVRAPR